jgi:p-hydroxybenzoate 3-monooxygenase
MSSISTLRTQVVIIGGGPSGLMLALLLRRHGIESIVLERHTRAHVEARIRAGLLEWTTVELLREAGIGDVMRREGLVHDGFELAFEGGQHRIDLKDLTGKSVLVYGQTEIQKHLGDECERQAGAIVWQAADVALHGFSGTSPRVSFTTDGRRQEIQCDFIAGCDGFHGVSRASVPREALSEFLRTYPFGWLGVLADVTPMADELVYANHARGFALCSMRSHQRVRCYIQCPQTDTVGQWPDERFWEELQRRLPAHHAARLVTGPSIEKSIAPLRSFVTEPMRFGRLFLVGDAAHIVPPTGAKGLNLAAADVRVLAEAIIEHERSGRATLLDEYSRRALDRVWKATRFSWWFTTLMHRFSDDPFAHRLQLAELRYIAASEAGSRSVAENYVGLPISI